MDRHAAWHVAWRHFHLRIGRVPDADLFGHNLSYCHSEHGFYPCHEGNEQKTLIT
jgi:hypothetical protein